MRYEPPIDPPEFNEQEINTEHTVYNCPSCEDEHDDQEGYAVYTEIGGAYWSRRDGTFYFTCPETGEKVDVEYHTEDCDPPEPDYDY